VRLNFSCQAVALVLAPRLSNWFPPARDAGECCRVLLAEVPIAALLAHRTPRVVAAGGTSRLSTEDGPRTDATNAAHGAIDLSGVRWTEMES
jgi:hypothetical protein